ncbi:hypothetical protein ATO8_00770 [Roseivivax marinus]|uniref:Uncharacterized protein n=1 Tax=Roseivivax marinus TaxID=1379903 RepID=W4HNU4_9RHOB|nr:hypothetical protein [Roseivivax marinus]ETW14397.1 hypothetical protein ATO8_00770 [Roseivivax marinus]
MSDPNHAPRTTNTHTRETHVEKRSGGSGAMAFIVGGLVVAVGILFFVFWGGGREGDTAANGGGDVNVSVEETGDAAEGAAESAAGAAESAADAAGDAAESAAESAESAAETATDDSQ